VSGMTLSSPYAGREPPLRVLCIDDNRDLADSETLLLQAIGFEARACYDGPTALAVAARFRPSVCLIDLNMPGMTGDVVAGRLKAQAPDDPLVLVAVTAMSDEGSARRLRAGGFQAHLVKPVDPFNLVAIVNTLWAVWEPLAQPTRDRPDSVR
jgi:two-component system OmpR family response regulator